MSIKIIFVDVDGVLNTAFTERRVRCHTFVDTRKILRLRDIVERTGAQIVLTSTWRITDTPTDKILYNALRAEFERVRCPVWIDVTPVMPRTKRWQEINAWLLLHGEVDDFVILDDWGMDEFRPLADRLVQTDPFRGLNKERAELAISLLNKESTNE